MNDLRLRIRLDRALRHTRRQHAELAELERELQLALGQDAGDAEVWLGRYGAGLQAHFALEEDLLFPILIGLGDEMHSGVHELVHQHDRLRGELARLASESNAYVLAAGLAALRVQISAHERLEESLASKALDELPHTHAEALTASPPDRCRS